MSLLLLNSDNTYNLSETPFNMVEVAQAVNEDTRGSR